MSGSDASEKSVDVTVSIKEGSFSEMVYQSSVDEETVVAKPSVTKTTIEVILDPEPTKKALVAGKDVSPVLNEVSCDSAVGSLLSSLYTPNGTLG